MAGPGVSTGAPKATWGAIPQHMNRNLLFTLLIVGMGLFIQQFDQTWWTGMIANTFFNMSFGEGTISAKTAAGVAYTVPWLSAGQQSALTSPASAAQGVGALSAGFLNHKYGTRFVLLLCAAMSTVGGVLEITSSTGGFRFWQMVVGKCFVTFCAGAAVVAIPSFLSQAAPREIRGAVVAIGQLLGATGALIGVVTVFFVAYMTGKVVWYIPIGIQFIGPLVLLASYFYIPESPRWLIEHGRLEDARRSLLFLRAGNDTDLDFDLVEMSAAIELQKKETSGAWYQLFKGTDLRRTLIVVGVNCFTVAIGQSYFGGYLVILMLSIGIQNPFLISIIITVVTIVAVAFSVVLLDKVGRRALLLSGIIFLFSIFLVIGILITVYDSVLVGGAADAAIALIILWFLGLGCTWSITPWVLTNEISSEPLRQKTAGLGIFSQYMVALIVQTVSPYISDKSHGNLQGKIVWIFIAVEFCAIFWIWFMIPETKGRSLEELDQMFRLKLKAREFKDYVMPATLPVVDTVMDSEDIDSKGDITHQD